MIEPDPEYWEGMIPEVTAMVRHAVGFPVVVRVDHLGDSDACFYFEPSAHSKGHPFWGWLADLDEDVAEDYPTHDGDLLRCAANFVKLHHMFTVFAPDREPRAEAETIDPLFGQLVDFMMSFENVFGDDWGHTRDAIAGGSCISKGGTFLDPGVDDESNNWGNRGALLEAYRDLRETIAASEMVREACDKGW